MSAQRRLSWVLSAKTQSYTLLQHKDTGRAWFKTGVVPTPNGFVYLYSQARHTTYRFIWKQREYAVTEDTHHGERGYATVARRVAREIIAGKYNK